MLRDAAAVPPPACLTMPAHSAFNCLFLLLFFLFMEVLGKAGYGDRQKSPSGEGKVCLFR